MRSKNPWIDIHGSHGLVCFRVTFFTDEESGVGVSCFKHRGWESEESRGRRSVERVVGSESRVEKSGPRFPYLGPVYLPLSTHQLSAVSAAQLAWEQDWDPCLEVRRRSRFCDVIQRF